MDFAAVLRRLKTFFDERRVRYALAGAFALHAHGVTRATAESILRLPGGTRRRSGAISNGMDSESDSGNSPEIELRVTAADVEALRAARRGRRVAPEEYARMLAQLPVSIEALRRRPTTRGEPFKL